MYQATPVTNEDILVNISTAKSFEIVEPDVNHPELTKQRISEVFHSYQVRLEERTRLHLGYPYNLDFDFSELHELQNYSINNLGDPFVESNYGVHSREFEVGVLEWFGRLWELPESEMWGYVTNCGTEGNLHGILVGRECLPDAILYASKETHYSVMKAARMYRMEAHEISTLETGEIDPENFKHYLQIGKQQNKPAVININIGTTVKGAVDDIDQIVQILHDEGYVSYGTQNEDDVPKKLEYFIHVDGALFGLMLPFLHDIGLNHHVPNVTFLKQPIHSISVSGHKFVGAPVPCGVVITRKAFIAKVVHDIEYLNSRDATIMGSRNGHAAIYLWYAISKKGMIGFRDDVELCMKNSNLLRELLQSHGIKSMLNTLSSTVVFERPTDHNFVKKWQLACERDLAHVVVMPSVSEEKLRLFVDDLIKSRESERLKGIGQELK